MGLSHFSTFPGSPNPGVAEASEPDEDHRDQVLPLEANLGHQRLEATPVREPGNEARLVAR